MKFLLRAKAHCLLIEKPKRNEEGVDSRDDNNTDSQKSRAIRATRYDFKSPTLTLRARRASGTFSHGLVLYESKRNPALIALMG